MTATLRARESSLAGVITYSANPRAHVSSMSALAVYAPPSSKRARESSFNALVPYASGGTVPRVSALNALAVYSTVEPVPSQSLAWTFTLDGHTFYVLDLGSEGTYLYDLSTKSWCKFVTQGNMGWNFRNGLMWNVGAPRYVGGDSTNAYMLEMTPASIVDDGFRDIPHAATAGIALRSRVYHSMSELRIAASAGELDETDGAAYIQLSYSDDGGQTYSAPYVVLLQVGSTPDGQQDIRFASLGSFMAPGRILQLYDVGGTLRLDGIDAEIDNYDGEPEAGESEQ